MRNTDLVEQDEFLQAPVLFKHGPWLLLLVGLALSVLSYVAGNWRVVEGRKGTYESAFQFADASATAVKESLTQVLGRLRQASYNLESMRAGDAEGSRVRKAFNEGLGLRGSGVEAMAVSADGQLLAATWEGPAGAGLAQQARDAAQMNLTVRGAQFLMGTVASPTNKTMALPVVERLSLPNGVEFVVYLVDTTLVTSVAEKAFAERSGWLRIEDRQGAPLLATTPIGPHGSELLSKTATASSVQEAMAQPLDYTSNRALVSSAASNPNAFKLTVGLREADALTEFKSRVDATWLIVNSMVVFLMSITGLTGFALRRFSSKEAYLRRLATIDILTNLPNRRSFHELLTKSVSDSKRTGKTLGLVFVDLDNFKYVNDSMGHDMGDSLLKEAAAALARSVRRGDRVCRLGGDEFTVLLNDVSGPSEALHIGERILSALNKPLMLRGVEVRTRASLGIALMPTHATNEADLMRFADTAMFRAKQGGKGCCVVYDESMAAQAMVKAQTASDLAHGIERDELFLVYQPKFCLRTGVATGFEALVRWKHPQRGMVFPGEFIPVAEEAGLIVDLGNWVMARAVRQLREWYDEGLGWQKVAVNVSALQLRGDDFISRVQRLLAHHGVPGQSLQVELTESSLALDARLAQTLVQELRAMGVVVAVDDFGTGYSSLGALQSFEIDCLKVDRSFVNAILTAQGDAICRAVVSLGHAMNMRVVAEGVETAEQRDALVQLGCDEVQGYLFAKPVAPADAVKYAQAAHPAISSSRPKLVAA